MCARRPRQNFGISPSQLPVFSTRETESMMAASTIRPGSPLGNAARPPPRAALTAFLFGRMFLLLRQQNKAVRHYFVLENVFLVWRFGNELHAFAECSC
jgi:hypothetical protein